MASALIDHITIDDKGTACVTGTRITVRHIAIETRLGLSPAQIREQYPHLSLAQIHAALAYYYDHQTEIDAEIGRGLSESEEARRTQPNPFTREELLRRRKQSGRAGGQ